MIVDSGIRVIVHERILNCVMVYCLLYIDVFLVYFSMSWYVMAECIAVYFDLKMSD